MIRRARKRMLQPMYIARGLPICLLAVGLTLVFWRVERPEALIHVGVQWARIGTLAMVMTGIIITGGIDLSVGSMIALCSVVMGVLWKAGVPAEVSSLACVAVGLLAGGANGTLVVVGLSPLVTTLATMAFYSGLAMWISKGQRLTGFPEPAVDLSYIGGIPTEYGLLAMVFVFSLVAIHFTRFGRWCYAIGDNKTAARFAAVPVATTQWILYAASGLVAGLLAVVYTMSTGAIPDAHRGLELEAIACVVVGGTLITGGRGGILLTLLGLAVISNVDIGLYFLSSDVAFLGADARLMVVGALLIAVAVGNEWLARKETSRRFGGPICDS